MESTKKRVLIVDDEPAIRESLSLLLKSEFDVCTAVDGFDALSVAALSSPDVILLDLMMPNLDGISTLQKLKQSRPAVPVIVLTAVTTVRTAAQAMRYGAFDCLGKPYEIDDLKAVIKEALLCENVPLPFHLREHAAREKSDFGTMVGKSIEMQKLFQKVRQVAETDSTVLITGESGTGKELIAKAIHDNSPRRSGPFVAINCAAIPETLIEAELFGHEKGAFTNAIDRRIGHCELADKGTLFLDEIGELTLPVQVKLLRFLQEQEFYRIGKSKPIHVDVRIVAATNRNLEMAIKEKRFREDLYYRVNVIQLKIPALRERREDIPALVQYVCNRYASAYRMRNLQFSAEAMLALCAYRWPGNVRELENIVESLLALSPQDSIDVSDLPERIRDPQIEPESPVASHSMNLEEAERRFETEIILKALKQCNYVQTRAANMLGISRRILKYKMDKLGISDRAPQQQN